MRTIWKFEIPISDAFSIPMPRAAKVLAVGEQNHGLVMWADVSTNQPKLPRRFSVRGTGNPIPHTYDAYIGTVQMSNGLVWHVYEEIAIS